MSIELAQRAVACKHWRWVAGMQSSHGARYLGGDCWVDKGAGGVVYADANDGELPDLDDPATIGCLLALVREAWDDQGLHCAGRYGSVEWLWHVQGGKPHGASFRRHVYAIGHGTEAEALVAALEAAPC